MWERNDGIVCISVMGWYCDIVTKVVVLQFAGVFEQFITRCRVVYSGRCRSF